MAVGIPGLGPCLCRADCARRPSRGRRAEYHHGPGNSAERAHPASRPGMSPSSDSLSSRFSQPPRKPSGASTVTATNHTVFDYFPSPRLNCCSLSVHGGFSTLGTTSDPRPSSTRRDPGCRRRCRGSRRGSRPPGIPACLKRAADRQEALDAAGQVAGSSVPRPGRRTPARAASTAAVRPEAESRSPRP